MRIVRVATCNLNQWALDYDGNRERIFSSIREAKMAGARYRVGPELEVTGYGCEDHFLEMDTFHHAWDTVAELLKDPDLTKDCLIDVGMPVLHKGVRYNARVFCLNHKILLIRPKMYLADDGNYRESRYFTSWSEERVQSKQIDETVLPRQITDISQQKTAPFGIAILQCRDGSIASETCEELFTPHSPHIWLGLNGVDIISNGSGSHHQLRKLHQRIDLIRSATAKGGGVYLYANQQGCDGGRLYYDGCALVSVNGEVMAQASQFSLRDVEVITAAVDLDDVRSFRGALASRGQQARATLSVPMINVDFHLCPTEEKLNVVAAIPRPVRYHLPEEEIAYGPAAWLWDYMRRTGASGYFLPLSGGADSSATAAIVSVMCRMVVRECQIGTEQVIRDARIIVGEPADSDYIPTDSKEFCGRILHTCYMATENSSNATKTRAQQLADEIGSYHLSATIDTMVAATIAVFAMLFGGKKPKYQSQGGSLTEDIALQNIQARLRMVLAYLLAQLIPWIRGRTGFLLVLGSANVDEALRGYMTKYDCSSADINPIGGIAKLDLRQFLTWAAKKFNLSALDTVVKAPPTAELRPWQTEDSQNGSGDAEHIQTDEEDMGMTYEELGWFGRLRKLARCGPYSMYKKLLAAWGPGTATNYSASTVAEKVQRFFRYYSINRHKATVLTPSYHAEQYSPEDNRFDLRPFLYPTSWTAAFRAIQHDVSLRESSPKLGIDATASSTCIPSGACHCPLGTDFEDDTPIDAPAGLSLHATDVPAALESDIGGANAPPAAA